MSPDFWMNLRAYELDLARRQSGKAIQRIPRRVKAGRVRPARQALPELQRKLGIPDQPHNHLSQRPPLRS
jgi:hypothetical protein